MCPYIRKEKVMAKQLRKTKNQTSPIETSISAENYLRNYGTNGNSKTQFTQELFTPSYEDIKMRAYLLHEERGGSDLDNWLEAERLLKEEHTITK